MGAADFFRRVIVNVRERPTSGDLNRLQNRIGETIRNLANAVLGEASGSTPTLTEGRRSAVANGFLGASFYVTPDDAATPYGLKIGPGVGFSPASPDAVTDYGGVNGLDWESGGNCAPLVLSAYQTGIQVPSVPASGHSRIDIIEVRSNFFSGDSATVGIFNPVTEVFDPTVANKGFNWDLRGRTGQVNAPAASTAAISYKVGVDFAGGIAGATEPSTTYGYMKIARINLDGVVGSITQDLIADLRRPLLPSGILHVAGDATIPGVAAGIGTEDFLTMSVPPGVTVKMAFQNNTPPAAGVSYTAYFYVLGTDLTGRSGGAGSAVATVYNQSVRCVTVQSLGHASMDSGLQDILDGTDTTWTVVNGNQSFALGQSYMSFRVTIRHPDGSALTNSERFNFSFTHNLG